MKKTIWMLAMSLVLLIAFGINVQAQPKEVTESITTTYYVTAKVLPLGEGRIGMSYDAIGLVISDTGQGLFHHATIRVLGSLTVEKGKWNDERASGVWNLMNGDKVFMTLNGTGQSPQPGIMGVAKGTVTIVGGTGKCSGIQGTFEMTRYSVPKPAIEGIVQSYVKATIKYNLP
jgi:hypothetical protein